MFCTTTAGMPYVLFVAGHPQGPRYVFIVLLNRLLVSGCNEPTTLLATIALIFLRWFSLTIVICADNTELVLKINCDHTSSLSLAMSSKVITPFSYCTGILNGSGLPRFLATASLCSSLSAAVILGDLLLVLPLLFVLGFSKVPLGLRKQGGLYFLRGLVGFSLTLLLPVCGSIAQNDPLAEETGGGTTKHVVSEDTALLLPFELSPGGRPGRTRDCL